jgi:hypothetical protein
MNLAFLGLLRLRSQGKGGACELCLAHGVSRLALFYRVGELSHSSGSRIRVITQGTIRVSRGFITLWALLLSVVRYGC